jgi:L-2-hydroxyglutarate oxidase LhgO
VSDSPRIGIVGAGILGLAVARRLGQVAPDAELTVLEKEPRVAAHQSSHNSGVAHAGVYYPAGSLKATLCRRGIGLLKAFCEERGLPYVECGKLIVARHTGELPALDELERRARDNGVPGLRRLTGPQLDSVEPHVRGVAALHSPSTAIVDFAAVARGLADEVAAAGGRVRLGFGVNGIERRGSETVLTAAGGEQLVFDGVVLCGGLHSDRLARLAGDDRYPVIVPFRGEYLQLVPERAHLVRGLVYPVPDPAAPFLGVHFTRRVDGGVDLGPNAVLALAREGYRRRDVEWHDLLETLGCGGFRRLARHHWRMGARELRSSLWRRSLLAQARSFVPELSLADVTSAPAGVRAQAVDRDGRLLDDFRITIRRGLVAVRNAPSPAATSSLAIAEHLVAGLAEAFDVRVPVS